MHICTQMYIPYPEKKKKEYFQLASLFLKAESSTFLIIRQHGRKSSSICVLTTTSSNSKLALPMTVHRFTEDKKCQQPT